MSEKTYTFEVTAYEVQALVEWHADPDRQDDMPPYLSFVDHIKRAAELIALAEGAS